MKWFVSAPASAPGTSLYIAVNSALVMLRQIAKCLAVSLPCKFWQL